MDIAELIAPTGILSAALFVFALINGIPRLRLLKYHAITGYACVAVVLFHSAVALLSHIFEPLGVLATVGMLLTAVSGRLHWKMRTHAVLVVCTLFVSILHVVFVLQ